MRFILSIAVVIVIGSAILAGCNNAAAPKPSETAKNNTANANSVQKTELQNTNSAEKVDSHGHTDDAPRITLADAKKDFDSGKAIFIDTRGKSGFDQGHIKGAINIPIDTFEAKFKEIPSDKKIIAYCS